MGERQVEELEIRERRVPDGWQVELFGPESAGEDSPRSWCTVVDVAMRVGHQVLATGGIGGVGTRPEHRRQGYSRRVLEASLALMQRERYALSFLHGIQDFYHRFGFITCMAEHEFAMATADLQVARPAKGLRIRPLKRADLPAVARRYNQENAGRTGSRLRVPQKFGGFPKGTWWTYRADAYVVRDAQDRLVGYVVCDRVEDHCRVSEVAGSTEAAFTTIANFLARRARRGEHRHVWVNAPGDHPFSVYCRRFGLRLHSLYPRNEKPMGRIIDLPKLIDGILPELAARWGTQDRRSPLTLRTDVGSVTLGWRGSGPVVLPTASRGGVSLGQQELTLLLCGYARASDLLAWGQAKIPRDMRPLMERLFPLQEAHMWWTDRF